MKSYHLRSVLQNIEMLCLNGTMNLLLLFNSVEKNIANVCEKEVICTYNCNI